MTYNLSYDYCSIVLLGISLFFYIVTPKFKSFQNRLFGVILMTNLVSSVLDALSAGLFMSRYAENILLNNTTLVFFQFAQHSLPPLYYVYLISIVFPENTIDKLKKRLVVLIPGVVLELCNLLTLFFPIAFIYDENGYSRTWLFWLGFSVLSFYMILCLVMVVVYKKAMGFLPKLAVLFYTLLTIGATWIQFIHPEMLVICFAACLTVYVMYLSLQSPILLKQALEDAENSKKIAEEASEAKSNFLANMSHEIRTPMNAICGMTYLLESFDLKSDAREYISTIQSASENLMSLINDLLNYSKVDTKTMELIETDYRVDSLIREIGGMVLNSIDSRRVAATLYIDPKLPMFLQGDVTKVKQIIYNLLNNAVKFTEDGAINLSISVEEETEEDLVLQIRVDDTGIGIKQDDMGKLFAQFSQVDMAKTRRRDGTGLGLALVKGYCDLMNGSVDAVSEYGNGSTFTARVVQKKIDNSAGAAIAALKNYVYIVYEKNPYVRRSIEMTLKSMKLSYTVEETFSAEAFEKFSKERYCLLFNYEQYGREIEAVDLSRFNDLYKLAMVDFSFILPEDCKDVHYSRSPFSLFTLLDGIGSIPQKEEKKEETVLFNSRTRVAVVDDNRVNLKVTGAILRKFGIEAKTMLSGYEILDELGSGEQYDLIFMDHMMPDLDGVETVKRIRGMHRGNTGNVPILALTANVVDGAREEFLNAGMNDALFKPVNVDDLKEALLKWLPPSMRIDSSTE